MTTNNKLINRNKYKTLNLTNMYSLKIQKLYYNNIEQINETLIENKFKKEHISVGKLIETKEINIPQDTYTRLSAISLNNNLDIETLLFLGHCKVVSLFSGQRNITTGFCVRCNKVDKKKEGILSSDFQILPFSINLGSDETWNSIALRVRKSLTNIRKLKNVKIKDLYEVNKLFDFSFAYIEKATSQKDEIALFEDESNSLLVEFHNNTNLVHASNIKCNIQYRSDNISEEQVNALEDSYIRVLESISEELQTVHTSSNWLSEKDENRLLSWNDTNKKYPIKSNLVELFEEQAYKTPNKTASIHKNEKLTYRQLNERSNKLARYLRNNSIGPDCLVGICMSRSNLMLISLLGILKAGAGYVPLDLNYPKERLQNMLDDINVELLLIDDSFNEKLFIRKSKIVQLDIEWSGISELPCTNLNGLTSPNNIAYLVFTSGSTGMPKAAVIEHRSVIELMYWAKDEFGLTALSGVLASSSICFDMSIFEIFAPLSWGGTVIIVDNILQLHDSNEKNLISLLSTIPSALCTIAELNWIPDKTKNVLLAGEPLTQNITNRIFESTKLEKIWNAYGLSEDTTYTTTSLITRESKEPINIGKPIANRQLYILDDYNNQVPVGVIGELYVSGNGLAREYMNRPKLTEERFLKNFFSDNNTDRMYRTGDLVRYRTDGTLDYIARKDSQIKLRGHRIELGEIESILFDHKYIENCAVVCRKEVDNNRLIAYVVCNEYHTKFSEQLIKEYLSKKLPEWMVPSTIVRLNKLPTTNHGKLDRNALPAPERCSW
ncbi:amino acid adenylation domain-containing protein [Mammaliicoccus sciuri]|uniref:amino acid adenylation domain-containing protein n=1 Tax=Mammaliicoccus sciuri TaxID=1296 RepID=UPI002898A269|nr:amino acid adenylation domain-containing protein [Mammaliicoccus sciuri]